MSIPRWRNVKYTDDGCNIYECLNCYQQWEARTNPEWAEWKHCPYCGIAWTGEEKYDEHAIYDRRGYKYAPQIKHHVYIQVKWKWGDDIIPEREWDDISDHCLWPQFREGSAIYKWLRDDNRERWKGSDKYPEDKKYYSAVANLKKLCDMIIEQAKDPDGCSFFMFADFLQLRIAVKRERWGNGRKQLEPHIIPVTTDWVEIMRTLTPEEEFLRQEDEELKKLEEEDA